MSNYELDGRRKQKILITTKRGANYVYLYDSFYKTDKSKMLLVWNGFKWVSEYPSREEREQTEKDVWNYKQNMAWKKLIDTITKDDNEE